MTLYFLHDTVSIGTIIPAMDRLDNHLNAQGNQLYHPTIQAVMGLTCKKINHYYSMTDLSSIYQIAMGKQHGFLLCILSLMLALVLHPDLKVKYFRQKDCADERIDNVIDLLCEVYVSCY